MTAQESQERLDRAKGAVAWWEAALSKISPDGPENSEASAAREVISRLAGGVCPLGEES